MDDDRDGEPFERPMRVEFFDEYLGEQRLTCARFSFRDAQPGATAAFAWRDALIEVELIAEYDATPTPADGFDAPQQLVLIGVEAFVAAYAAYRRQTS